MRNGCFHTCPSRYIQFSTNFWQKTVIYALHFYEFISTAKPGCWVWLWPHRAFLFIPIIYIVLRLRICTSYWRATMFLCLFHFLFNSNFFSFVGWCNNRRLLWYNHKLLTILFAQTLWINYFIVLFLSVKQLIQKLGGTTCLLQRNTHMLYLGSNYCK